MTIEQAFGHVIRKLRKERKFSQEKLAFASMLDRTFISSLECGRKQPTLITIFQLADALNLPASSIISEVELLLKYTNMSVRQSLKSSVDQYPVWGCVVDKKTIDMCRKFGGKETILLVDDETLLLQVFEEFLVEFGYKVYKAVDVRHAVEVFSNKFHDISLVIMDVIMPNLDGVKAYKEMTKIKPDVNVLFMSAYSANCFDGFDSSYNFVRKPVTPYELIGKVRSCIDGASAELVN